ncbi:MAG: hypothetical protein IH851_01890 [Armatimonadetes bacterium]|nr:hypothetical protein [Armatimonadota bacterium]
MITSTLVRRCRIGGLAAGLWLAALPVAPQGVNLEFNCFICPPELGGGAPSAAFGAAAGQPGFWNPVPMGNSGEHWLYHLNGVLSDVRLTVSGVSGASASATPATQAISRFF